MLPLFDMCQRGDAPGVRAALTSWHISQWAKTMQDAYDKCVKVAIANDHVDVVTVLLECTRATPTQLLELAACASDAVNVVRMLLDSKADPNNNRDVYDPHHSAENTPLDAACLKSQNAHVLQLLLDYKAKPNATSMNDDPPLFWCTSVPCIRTLVKAKADPNFASVHTERAGQTPLDMLITDEAQAYGILPEHTLRAILELHKCGAHVTQTHVTKATAALGAANDVTKLVTALCKKQQEKPAL